MDLKNRWFLLLFIVAFAFTAWMIGLGVSGQDMPPWLIKLALVF